MIKALEILKKLAEEGETIEKSILAFLEGVAVHIETFATDEAKAFAADIRADVEKLKTAILTDVGLEEIAPGTENVATDELTNLKAKAAHLDDVYDALGIKWGDDPFKLIADLEAAKAALVKTVGPGDPPAAQQQDEQSAQPSEQKPEDVEEKAAE